MIVWRDQLSVGNDLIDHDHQYLITLINKAEQILRAGQTAQLTPVLSELVRYGQLHFEREERVARGVGYPGAENLHSAHTALTHSLQHFIAESSGRWHETTIDHFTQFLRDWLLDHVIREDLLMKPWLAKFSPAFVPA